MKTIYLVHGFNVRDGGDATVNMLIPGLIAQGHKVRSIKYGHVGRLGVRACNDNTAATIASTVEPNSVIIAHSNGAALVYEAAQLGARFSDVFLINPALDNTKEIANAKRTTVFYAPSDPWTKLAKWIPFSNWGNMGATGYRGLNEFIVNINLDKLVDGIMKHSGIFQSVHGRPKLLKVIRGML